MCSLENYGKHVDVWTLKRLDRLESLDKAQFFRVQINTSHIFLIVQNQQKMKRIWGLKLFVCNPFFPSIFLFIHANLFLFFFGCLATSKGQRSIANLDLMQP